MKRNLLIVAIALLTVAFVSCKKDGVYKPKQKISKIYNELIRTTVSEVNGVSTTVNDTVKPYVTEEWNWGKKTLESIVYKDMDGRNDGTCFFTYDDKNRITEMKEGETKVEYSYSDDKKLQITKLYSEGKLILAMEIAYEDKLPHIITSTSYDDDALIKKSAFARRIVPSFILNAIENEIQSKAVHTTVYTATVDWDGKNISQVVVASEGKTISTTTYEYDSNLNPYFGMYGEMVYGFEADCYSKNNVVKRTEKYTDMTITSEYTFEYDGKYPKSYSYTLESDFMGIKTTTTHTTTYEYTK